MVFIGLRGFVGIRVLWSKEVFDEIGSKKIWLKLMEGWF